MKKVFKTLAILIIIVHVFAGLIFTGIIPIRLFRNLKMPNAGRLAEYILSLQNDNGQDGAGTGEKNELEEEITDDKSIPEAVETVEKDISEESGTDREQTEGDEIRIELSDTLPPLEEEDLYDLVRVLAEKGALRAVDGQGEDYSDQIICELAADITDPGHFTAVFSLKAEDGQIVRGPSADMRVEMTEPFLGFRQDEVTITAGTDYDPFNNILICMDLDGTVLTEYVEQDGDLNTEQAGDYELRFFIYSRVNTSSASRIMTVHVADR